jgi:hypothetical protein
MYMEEMIKSEKEAYTTSGAEFVTNELEIYGLCGLCGDRCVTPPVVLARLSLRVCGSSNVLSSSDI